MVFTFPHRITEVRMTPGRPGRVEHIAAVLADDQWLSVFEVLGMMQYGHNFYVDGLFGARADVIAVNASLVAAHIKTVADHTTTDNLLSLPGGPNHAGLGLLQTLRGATVNSGAEAPGLGLLNVAKAEGPERPGLGLLKALGGENAVPSSSQVGIINRAISGKKFV